MTKEEIILANKEYLSSIFHYYKEPLVVTRAKASMCTTPTIASIWISSAAS